MSEPIKVDFSGSGKGKGQSSTKEVLIPPDKAGLKIVINILITLIGGGILYYFMLPPMNFRSVDFYIFWAVVVGIYVVSAFITSKAFIRPEYVPYVKKQAIVPIIVVALLGVVLLVGYLSSCVLFRANAFSQLISLSDQTDLNSSVTKMESTMDFENVPMIDSEASEKLADKVLGDLASIGLESQFDIATEYSTQINYKGSPCRVYPLRYGNVFKWLNNTSDGFPGFVIVNMNTQKTEFRFLNKDNSTGYMRYSPTEHFQKNLKRIVRFEYPTALLGTISFEIDESGTPYWICEVLQKKVGLISGDDVKGIIMVDAVTGDSIYYSAEELASGSTKDASGKTVDLLWIDQVYDAALLTQQYDYFGTYNNGFWNSVFGQTGVKKTTTGCSYLAMGEDVYVYTGVTSVSSDESILGFVLINQRTKEAMFYPTTGATEIAAENSAEGALSDKGWHATFPLLINLDGEATYFMALKDDNNVVKSYAMVNVSNYNIVATDTADGNPSLSKCIENYEAVMKDKKSVTLHVDTSVDLKVEAESGTDTDSAVSETETKIVATVTAIRSQMESGSTVYYIKTNSGNKYFKVSAADYPEALFFMTGDSLEITYKESGVKSQWIEVTKIAAAGSESSTAA